MNINISISYALARISLIEEYYGVTEKGNRGL